MNVKQIFKSFKTKNLISFEKGDKINRLLKITIALSVLFLLIGCVSAHENTTDIVKETQNQDDTSFSDIIDKYKENGTLNLEEKTYTINSESHVILNNSLTINGNNATIDGNNNNLYLDIYNETESSDDDYPMIKISNYGYSPQNTGKNITFKNITFKDLTITTWHEMKFHNCNFINTTVKSWEMDTNFKNCSFDKSKIEIVVFYGGNYPKYSKVIDCIFNNSQITYEGVRTQYYIELVGSDRFYTTNSIDLINSRFYRTNISLSRYNMSIDNSNFSDSNLEGGSNIINITNSEFKNPKIGLHMSDIAIEKSMISNSTSYFSAGYFAKGCSITIKNSLLSDLNMTFTVNYASRGSYLKIENTNVNNINIDSTDTEIDIDNCELKNSTTTLFFSNIHIKNSTFINDGSINDTIITKRYKEIYHYDENGLVNTETVECLQKTNYTSENSYLINGSGKYEITPADINIDTLYNLTSSESLVYYFNDKITFELRDCNGNPVLGVKLYLEDMDEYVYPVPSAITDKNGIATFTLNKIGNLNLNVFYETEGFEYRTFQHKIKLNLTVKPTIKNINVKTKLNSNVYSKINGALETKLITSLDADLSNIKIAYKIGKKTYYAKTNSKGIAVFKIPKNLNAGSHKIKINVLNTNVKKTVSLKIAKAKTTVKAPKVTNKHKKSKYFKMTIKAFKKPVSNVKVKIKVYTKNKYKTYIAKTNKKGIAKLNTKNLKKGKHKVVISSKNSNYKISKKSEIKIK